MSDGTEMAQMESSSYPQFLLDFLYVDVDRVRSYLAQLAGGVATTASEAVEQARVHGAEASVHIAKGTRLSTRTDRSETNRTLGDLIVPAFEEEATAAGYLIDVTGDFTDPAAWHRGDVHAKLPVGTIIRHSGQTRLFDPVHLSELVQHFEGTAEAVAKITGSTTGTGKGGGRATPKGGGQAVRSSDLRGLTKLTEPIRKLIENLLAGGISIRVFPCGPNHPDCGFGGILLDRSEYIEPERSAVFARHGVTVSEWTVVGVITRLSQRVARSGMDEIDSAAMLRESGGIDRIALEALVLQLLELMEGLGMSEGPAWPSIGITPLAVYRTIQQPPRSETALSRPEAGA